MREKLGSYRAHPCYNRRLVRAQAAWGIGGMLELIPPGGMGCIDVAEQGLLVHAPSREVMIQNMSQSSCEGC